MPNPYQEETDFPQMPFPGEMTKKAGLELD